MLETKGGKLNVSVAKWTAAERFANILPQMTPSIDALTILLQKIWLGFSTAEKKICSPLFNKPLEEP